MKVLQKVFAHGEIYFEPDDELADLIRRGVVAMEKLAENYTPFSIKVETGSVPSAQDAAMTAFARGIRDKIVRVESAVEVDPPQGGTGEVRP